MPGKKEYGQSRKFLCVIFAGAYSSIEAEQIQTAKADQSIDDPGNPAHASKDKSNQIEIEEADQSPVDRADYGKSKTETI